MIAPAPEAAQVPRHGSGRPARPTGLCEASRREDATGHSSLGQEISIPHWALKKRARQLGLARTKELPGSERELVILSGMRG